VLRRRNTVLRRTIGNDQAEAGRQLLHGRNTIRGRDPVPHKKNGCGDVFGVLDVLELQRRVANCSVTRISSEVGVPRHIKRMGVHSCADVLGVLDELEL
jgi:hypothetical protein